MYVYVPRHWLNWVIIYCYTERFYGYWDDRDSEFGIMHNMEIHYFLGDDTIEMKETMPANSGMEAGPMFLRRMRLPRVSFFM